MVFGLTGRGNSWDNMTLMLMPPREFPDIDYPPMYVFYGDFGEPTGSPIGVSAIDESIIYIAKPFPAFPPHWI